MLGRRIFLYLIGVGIGCVVVYFTLIKGRDRNLDAWFPSERVLERLRSDSLVMDARTTCLLKCYQLQQKDIDRLLLQGDVDFSESDPRKKPQKYMIREEEKGWGVLFETADSLATIKEISFPEKEINCDCP